jgi:hypothetical protein
MLGEVTVAFYKEDVAHQRWCFVGQYSTVPDFERVLADV